MREIDPAVLSDLTIQELNYMQLAYVRRALREDFNAALLTHNLQRKTATRLMQMEDGEIRQVANIGLSMFSLRDQNLESHNKMYGDVRVACLFMRQSGVSSGNKPAAKEAVFVGS